MSLSTPQDRYINAGNIKTRYWSIGDKGSTVLLLHGLGASAEVWLPNIDALAKNHRVLIPDLAGFGRSEQPSPAFSPLDYTSIIDDFLKALNIKKASIIGHSLGGGIALHYALQFSPKVEKLVLVDCAGFGKEVIWSLRLMSLPLIGELISYPSRKGVELFFKLAVNNPEVISKDFVDIYYELFNRPGFQTFLLKLTRMLVNVRCANPELLAPILGSLRKIKRPTLIVWGKKDRVFPLQHAYYGKKEMTNAELCIMDQCGHIPNLERPEEFNRIVLDFLAA